MLSSLLVSPSKFWTNHGDQMSLSFPLFDSPYYFLSVIATTVVYIKLIGPRIIDKARAKETDYRPVMIIFNGLFFGISGAGLMLMLAVSNSGEHMFSCVNPNSDDLRVVATKHLAYVYAIVAMLDLGRFIIAVHRNAVVSNFRLAHSALWPLIVFAAVAFYPVGHFAFVGFVHCLYRVLYYGYLVMTTTSPEMVPKNLGSWKTTVEAGQLVTFLSIFAHQSYFFLTPNCHGKYVALLFAVYSGLASLALLAGLRNRIGQAANNNKLTLPGRNINNNRRKVK